MLWLVQLLAGSLLMGLSVNLFLLPQKLAEGGAIGVAIVAHYSLGFPTWLTFLVVNLPLAAVGWRVRGWGFIAKSLLGVAAFTGAMFATGSLPPVTSDTLLAIVYGGLFMGTGLGLVLRSGCTTGGTEMLAILLHQRFGLSVGSLIMAIDASVLTLAGLLLGWHAAMYSAITLAISSRLVDYIQEGFYGAKGVTIITAEPQAIARRILDDLERGCTLLQGVGAYTGQPRTVVYAVVQRSELTAVKRIVYGLDPRAFVVVGDVREVVGEGFKEWEVRN